MRKKRSRLARNNTIAAYIFMTPTIFYLVFWMIIPIVAALILSFTNYNLLEHNLFNPVASGLKFIGFNNFAITLKNSTFQRSVIQTMVFAFFTVVLTNIFGLAFALIANSLRGKSFYRTAYFIPNITSVAVLVIIFDALFRKGSLVLQFLSLFGIPEKTWRVSPEYVMPLAIIMTVWVGAGYSMLIFLAGLQEITQEVYEAASIDGASPSQSFFHITLPLLNNKTFFLMATGFIGALQVFDIMQILSQSGESPIVGGPGGNLWTVVYYVYDVGWTQNKMGRASAVSFLLLIIIVVFTAVQRKIFKDETY